MAAEFLLKQHLKLSPNAQIKNMVPESISAVPPESEWKVGRMWFNTTIGKYQGIYLVLNPKTGLPVEPILMEVRVLGADELGPTSDGEYWPDGLFQFDTTTKIADAMDDVNEALKDLAPSDASLLKGNLNVGVTFKTGKISQQNSLAPHTLNLSEIQPGTELNYIITTDSFSATLPTEGLIIKGKQQTQFGKADKGVIKLYLDDTAVDDGINLFTQFNESSRDYYGVIQGFDPDIIQPTSDSTGVITNLSVNPNKLGYRSTTDTLTINTISRYNDFKKWQQGTGTINLNNLVPGKHTFYVEHSGLLGGPYKTNTSTVFYDPNTTAPQTRISDFSLQNGTTKYVSGIPFYNTDITFNLTLTVNDAFSYTYWDKPIRLYATDTDACDMAWNHITSNLKDTIIPLWSDTIEIESHTINYTRINSTTESIELKAKAGKTATGYGEEKNNIIKMLIDTNPISGNSTSMKETFFDENFRLEDTTDFNDAVVVQTGNWDSASELTLGKAQVYMGALLVAQRDFNEFGVDINYSSLSDNNQKYYRSFFAANKPASHGILKVTTTATIGVDFDISIKFPGITGWLNINELYDVEDFVNNHMVDGTACGTNPKKSTSGYEFSWTIGLLSTYNSNYGYVIMVTLKNNNVKLNEIEEISNNWR